MKIRVVVLATLLLVLAGTAANARDAASVKTNAQSICCDPPPVCGGMLCSPDAK
jgi:hypothetical protein